jgi:type I restriction enzyme, S subunit
MEEDWRTYKLEDILEVLIDYRGKTPKKKTHGIPLVTAKIVKQGRIQEPNEFIAASDYDAWMTRGMPKVGDVVLTTEAPLGEVAQISDSNIALAQRIVTLRGKHGILDNAYLKYFLLSSKGQSRLEQRQSGTTVFGIKQSELRKVEIDCPSFSEQRAIASILSALDDKIELNLQMNKTLEDMAMALYKHWFVDFGPFRDGEFIDSVLGEIPVGWEVKNIGQIVKILGGYAFKSKDFIEDGEIVVKIKNIARNIVSIVGSDCISSDVAEKTNSKFQINAGSFLVAMTGAEVGKVGIVPDYGRRLWLNQRVGMITEPKFESADILVGNFLQSDECYNVIQNLAYGSAQPNISATDIESISLPIPKDISILDGVLLQIRYWHEQRIMNLNENQTLTSLRDTLLPKLISGEIRVKDAAKTMAEVL